MLALCFTISALSFSSFMNKLFIKCLFVPLIGLMIGCSGSGRKRERQAPDEKPTVVTNISPKFYLEHSGSMFGYDGQSNESQFKQSLTSLVQDFRAATNQDSTAIFIVNDKVYNYPGTFTDLIRAKSIFENKVGNPAYTNFKTIFDTILGDLKTDEVAFLFSDLIYSGENSQGKLPKKIMNEAEQLCRTAFASHAADISVLVLKLQSDYNGNYYPYNSPNKGKIHKGSRPYYVTLFAKNKTMEKFMRDGKYNAIRDFEELPGFQQKLFFSRSNLLSDPYYTILQNDPDSKGTFTKGDRDLNKNGLHAIDNVDAPHRGGEKLTISVAVSFPEGALNTSQITNPNNYVVESLKDGFKVKSISPIKTTDGTTHKVVLEAQKFARGERDVKIKLKRNFPPDWVLATNSDDDSNIKSADFDTQTFGLGSIAKGINNAYQTTSSSNSYFTLNLKLKE
jgi:hypothetical protein